MLRDCSWVLKVQVALTTQTLQTAAAGIMTQINMLLYGQLDSRDLGDSMTTTVEDGIAIRVL